MVLQIRLIDEKKEPKIYTNDFLNLKHLRLTMEMNVNEEAVRNKLETDGKSILTSQELLDIYTDYVVRIFNNSFTKEELELGLESKNFYNVVASIVKEVYPQSKNKVQGEEKGKK